MFTEQGRNCYQEANDSVEITYLGIKDLYLGEFDKSYYICPYNKIA